MIDSMETYERWQRMLYKDWTEHGGDARAFIEAFVLSVGVVARMCIRDEFIKRSPHEKHEALYSELSNRYDLSTGYVRKICNGER